MTRRAILGLVILLALLTTSLAVCPARPARKAKSVKWPRYDGPMFSISYPPGFTVRPSVPEGGAADSAFFTSRDKKVEFYVFSPLWDGEPTDIRRNPKTEVEVSSRTQTQDKPLNPKRL